MAVSTGKDMVTLTHVCVFNSSSSITLQRALFNSVLECFMSSGFIRQAFPDIKQHLKMHAYDKLL